MEEETKDIRENLSQFLDSYQMKEYGGEQELKVLSWPEIYFELGKLKKEHSNFYKIKLFEDKFDHFENKINYLEKVLEKAKDEN